MKLHYWSPELDSTAPEPVTFAADSRPVQRGLRRLTPRSGASAPRRRRNNGGTAPNKIGRARHNPGILPSTPRGKLATLRGKVSTPRVLPATPRGEESTPRVFAANGIKTNVPDLVTELEITPARLTPCMQCGLINVNYEAGHSCLGRRNQPVFFGRVRECSQNNGSQERYYSRILDVSDRPMG